MFTPSSPHSLLTDCLEAFSDFHNGINSNESANEPEPEISALNDLKSFLSFVAYFLLFTVACDILGKSSLQRWITSQVDHLTSFVILLYTVTPTPIVVLVAMACLCSMRKSIGEFVKIICNRFKAYANKPVRVLDNQSNTPEQSVNLTSNESSTLAADVNGERAAQTDDTPTTIQSSNFGKPDESSAASEEPAESNLGNRSETIILDNDHKGVQPSEEHFVAVVTKMIDEIC